MPPPDFATRLKTAVADVAGDEPIIKLGRVMSDAGGYVQDAYRRVRNYVQPRPAQPRRRRTTDIRLPSERRTTRR